MSGVRKCSVYGIQLSRLLRGIVFVGDGPGDIIRSVANVENHGCCVDGKRSIHKD